MSGHRLSPDQPSPLVRNYAKEVVEAYLDAAGDSARAAEIEELYAEDDVIEAAARIVDAKETDWRV